jgi:lipoprotein-releasing system permease protein
LQIIDLCIYEEIQNHLFLSNNSYKFILNLVNFISEKLKNTKRLTFSSTVNKIGMLSVAFGICIVIISISVLTGFKKAIINKIYSFGGNIQVSKITLNNSSEEHPFKTDSKVLNLKDASIEHIQFSANKVGLLKSESEQVGIVLKGINDIENSSFKLNLISGKMPAFTKDSNYSKEILISKKLFDDLKTNLNEELIAIFPPKARRLKIVGVYETGLEEIDKNFIIGDLKLVQKLNNWQQNEVGHIDFFLKDFNQTNQIYSKILSNAELELQVIKTTNLYPEIFDWLKMLDRNAEIVLILILIVAAFNMVSVLIIMLMERSEMIGMIKTLGGTNLTIKKIFASMGFKIILKGLFYGNLFGLGISFLQLYLKIIPLDAANYFINFVPIEFNLLLILMVNVLFLFIITFAIFIPISIITKMSPLVALKFKK